MLIASVVQQSVFSNLDATILDAYAFGPSFVYTSTNGRQMNEIFEDKHDTNFANGQSRRDLRLCPDARQLETQLMEAIDNVGDLVRYVDISSRAIAINQRRSL
jgi:hypothetical protein